MLMLLLLLLLLGYVFRIQNEFLVYMGQRFSFLPFKSVSSDVASIVAQTALQLLLLIAAVSLTSLIITLCFVVIVAGGVVCNVIVAVAIAVAVTVAVACLLVIHCLEVKTWWQPGTVH